MTNELYEKHCWALVDLDAMQSNLALIKKTVGAPVCCVVKADAYGHGAIQVSRKLEQLGWRKTVQPLLRSAAWPKRGTCAATGSVNPS